MTYMAEQMQKHNLKVEELRATAGDVFIFHEQLYHGGKAINDFGPQRRSVVSHFRSGDPAV